MYTGRVSGRGRHVVCAVVARCTLALPRTLTPTLALPSLPLTLTLTPPNTWQKHKTTILKVNAQSIKHCAFGITNKTKTNKADKANKTKTTKADKVNKATTNKNKN